MWRVGLAVLVVASLLFPGCMSTQGTPSSQSAPQPASHPTVVALIDSGLDPKHIAFNGSVPSALVFAARAVEVPRETLTGATTRARAGDDPVVFHPAGTRVLIADFTPAGQMNTTRLDPANHGTGTASLVARDAPASVIVMLKIDSNVCASTQRTDCLVDPSVAAAMSWAARQPWIDVISVSLGLPGNPYDPALIHKEAGDYVAASRLAAQNGKLLVASAGNSLSVSAPDYFSGPPWIIAVQGHAVPSENLAQNARFADFSANYSEQIASSESPIATQNASGTSISAPIVAATIADAIDDLKTMGMDSATTRSHLREALNASAEPNQLDSDTWGYLHAGLAGLIAEHAIHPTPHHQRSAGGDEEYAVRSALWQMAPFISKWSADSERQQQFP